MWTFMNENPNIQAVRKRNLGFNQEWQKVKTVAQSRSGRELLMQETDSRKRGILTRGTTRILDEEIWTHPLVLMRKASYFVAQLT